MAEAPEAQVSAFQAGGLMGNGGDGGDGGGGGESGYGVRRDIVVGAVMSGGIEESDAVMLEETFDDRLERELFRATLPQNMDTTTRRDQETTTDLLSYTNGDTPYNTQPEASTSTPSQVQKTQLDGTISENPKFNDINLISTAGTSLDFLASSQTEEVTAGDVQKVRNHHHHQDGLRDSAATQTTVPGSSVPGQENVVRLNSTQDAEISAGPNPAQATIIPAASQNGPQQASIGLTQTSTMFTSLATARVPVMPPPAAPASMLRSLRPSARAKEPRQQVREPSIWGRLIAVTVILFRTGKAYQASNIGQFTIDLIGKELWDAELPTYMSAPPLDDDISAILPLLKGAVDILKNPECGDPVSAGFLDGMMALMD